MRMRPTMLLATLLAVGLMPMAAEAQTQGNDRPTPRQTIRNTNPEETFEGNAETRRPGQQGTLTQQRTQGTTQTEVQRRELQGTRIDGQAQQGMQGMDQQLSLLAAAELAISNHCEIQMAQMAMDKIENDQVKQFAQTMIRDHQQLNQQLMQAMPQLSSMIRMDSSAAHSERSSSLQSSQSTQSSQLSQSTQSQQPGLRDSESDSQSSPNLRSDERSQAQAGQSSADRTASNQPGQPSTTRSQETQATERATGYRGAATQPGASGSTSQFVSKLVSLCEETAQNKLQMAQQDMQDKQGKEADMTYMGTQVVMHQQTLAHLQALQGEGTPEFQQIVQQAEDKVSQHLSQAKSIVENLSSESGSSQTGQSGQDGQNRSSTSPRNQGSPQNN